MNGNENAWFEDQAYGYAVTRTGRLASLKIVLIQDVDFEYMVVLTSDEGNHVDSFEISKLSDNYVAKSLYPTLEQAFEEFRRIGDEKETI